ncbi:MAG TPA: sigma-70 family RNA polymerase sigma factor [Acidimicrobiia bacterium]|nr:sigma-70 family RNA polymerase sigma factor [Acidimicrobiia bacterium]
MEPEGLDRRQDSFDAFFESHYDSVYRYCLRRLGAADAEDAAAEVFAVAWRRIDKMPAPQVERAWLLGVAYRVIGNHFRGRMRWARLVGRLEFATSRADPGDSAVDGDFRLLHLALQGLRPADRELLRLASWDGLTRREIAEVMGINVNAVDQRLFRARARMKDRFERLREDELRVGTKEASA